jgi:hypothetical protein
LPWQAISSWALAHIGTTIVSVSWYQPVWHDGDFLRPSSKTLSKAMAIDEINAKGAPGAWSQIADSVSNWPLLASNQTVKRGQDKVSVISVSSVSANRCLPVLEEMNGSAGSPRAVRGELSKNVFYTGVAAQPAGHSCS